MLYIFGGLPGTGKSTLSRYLSAAISGAYMRIDSIEQVLRNCAFTDIYDEGYQVAFALAEENLKNGISVVADSTNPVEESRQGWITAAQNAGTSYVEIEVVCSDKVEHRTRIESRSTDIAGLQLPSWQSVIDREYSPWTTAEIRIDTAGKTPEQSQQMLLDLVAQYGAAHR